MRVTGPLIKVLTALLEAEGDVYGLALIRLTGLKSGALYPLLDRLEAAGWVTSSWEDEPPCDRPRRRLYKVTGTGGREARKLLVEHGVHRVLGSPVWT